MSLKNQAISNFDLKSSWSSRAAWGISPPPLRYFFVNVGPPKSPGRQTFQLNLTFQLTYAQKPDLNEQLSTQGENKNWYSTKNMLSKPKRAVSTLSLLFQVEVYLKLMFQLLRLLFQNARWSARYFPPQTVLQRHIFEAQE